MFHHDKALFEVDSDKNVESEKKGDDIEEISSDESDEGGLT